MQLAKTGGPPDLIFPISILKSELRGTWPPHETLMN